MSVEKPGTGDHGTPEIRPKRSSTRNEGRHKHSEHGQPDACGLKLAERYQMTFFTAANQRAAVEKGGQPDRVVTDLVLMQACRAANRAAGLSDPFPELRCLDSAIPADQVEHFCRHYASPGSWDPARQEPRYCNAWASDRVQTELDTLRAEGKIKAALCHMM